jgi:transcriptional regulator GlxA family with amidase domain
VRQAIRLMKENAAGPLSHEELAAMTGTSARYLNILFKAHTGYSIKTYLARVRVERACQLLAESTMNVSQIAETLGYADIYFFSKQFKQFKGESPSRYRSRTHESRSH